MAVEFRKGINLNGQRATNAGDPSSATDLTTRQWVEALVQGLTDLKDPVRAATTGNITLSAPQTIDGVSVIAGDRVLVKNQTTASANGIYVVAAGSWTRATDADTNAEVSRGLATTVLEGNTKGTGTTTANPVTYVMTTADPITLNTTSLAFSPIGSSSSAYSAGSGLTEAPAGQFNVGAGTGISVNADDVAVDTTVVSRIYQADCAATTNPQNFTHGLGKRPVVQVVKLSDGSVVLPDVTVTTTTITVDWGAAPTAAEYRVLAVG